MPTISPAFTSIEMSRTERETSVSRSTFSRDLARPEIDLREDLGDAPAGHEFDELVVIARLGVERRDPPAVAQHRDAVPDAADLAHAMCDVDDADALVLRLLDQGEQALGLALRQRGGRLIEDQDGGLRSESLGDLHHLLFGARQIGDAAVGFEGKIEPLEDAHGAAVYFGFVEEQPLGHLFAEKKVLLHGQLRHEREFLKDGADAVLASLMHRPKADHLVIEEHRAGRQVSAPETSEISVDLPAPFSPNSTCTSPRRKSKSTSISASTPGKRLEMFFRTRISWAPEAEASGAAEIRSALDVMIGFAAFQSTVNTGL